MSAHRCAVPRCDGTTLGHDLAVEFPDETRAFDEAMERAAQRCYCHGPDRPHAPHKACDKGCQPDWHRDDCAIYERVVPTACRHGHLTDKAQRECDEWTAAVRNFPPGTTERP